MSRAALLPDDAGAAAISQPPPAADDETAIELPAGFVQHEALARIAAYVAAQLHAGLSEREIMRRLHGWQREGE